MRLSELGESGLLAELERRGLAGGLDFEGAWDGERVVTQDVLVEGAHFRLGWTSWRDLGYKAAAVNLSDLAAMGAEPQGLLVSLALPPDMHVEDVLELYEGLNEPAVPVVGGDTVAAPTIVLTVTALGASERVPGRAGARPGDVLVVTGPLGGSAAGLYALEHALEGFDELVRMHRRPPLRLAEGRRLAALAHAMLDVSDGILADAAKMADRSGCRVVIDVERLPLAPGIGDVADLPFWARGEDYELLAAVPSDDATALGLPVIGSCERGSGVEPRGVGSARPSGWDSFRRSSGAQAAD